MNQTPNLSLPELAPVCDFIMPFWIVEIWFLIELIVDLIRIVPHEPISVPYFRVLKCRRNVGRLIFGLFCRCSRNDAESSQHRGLCLSMLNYTRLRRNSTAAAGLGRDDASPQGFHVKLESTACIPKILSVSIFVQMWTVCHQRQNVCPLFAMDASCTNAS